MQRSERSLICAHSRKQSLKTSGGCFEDRWKNSCAGHSSASEHRLAIGNTSLKRNGLHKWRWGDCSGGGGSQVDLHCGFESCLVNVLCTTTSPPFLNGDRTQRISHTQSHVNNPQAPFVSSSLDVSLSVHCSQPCHSQVAA